MSEVAKRLLKAFSQVCPILHITIDALVDVDLCQVPKIEPVSDLLWKAFYLSYPLIHEQNKPLEPRKLLLHLFGVTSDRSSLPRFLRVDACDFCQTAVSTRRFQAIALGEGAVSHVLLS